MKEVTKLAEDNYYPGVTTMTVEELVAVLLQYPSDTPVLATWEGVHAGIRLDNIELEGEGQNSVLVIDVGDYG